MDIVDRARAMFTKLDVNKSGYLEREELLETVAHWAAAKGNSIVDVSDTSRLMDEMLRSVDIDKDGRINAREFIDLFETMVATQQSVKAPTGK